MPFDPLNPGQTGNPGNPVKKTGSMEVRKNTPAPTRAGKSAAEPGKPAPSGVRRPAGARPAAPGVRPAAAKPAASGVRPAATKSAVPSGRPTAAKSAAPGGRPAGARPADPGGRTADVKPAVPGRKPTGTRPASSGGRRVSSAPAGKANSVPAEKSRKPASGGAYSPRFAAPKQKSPGFRLDNRTLTLAALLIVGSLILIGLSIHLVTKPSGPIDYVEVPEIPPLETAAPVIPTLVSEANITVTGDLLPHKTIYSKGSAIYKDEQDYDFSPIFKYLGGYTDKADYAIANLETSLFGPDKPYSGNPRLNTPDQIVDGAKGAGFDMLLTANNHCNDTDLPGVLRTVQVIREKGMKALGTNLDSSEQKYHIQDINGIRIGMVCYTYDDSKDPNQVTFNYHPLPKDSSDLVCSFPKFSASKSREPFYEQLNGQISEMRQKGADAIVVFLHWGEEYHLEPTGDQKEMAQRLCNMGVDLIVGGHPHVVEPVELLSSTENPEHKTVCLYSLGNAVSNQRREEMTSQKSGHTEDGMLFNITFQKYSDNSVYLSGVEVIPTWVNKFANPEGKREYNILPLDNSMRDMWQTMFSLDDAVYQKAVESYGRTMNIAGAGVEASNEWLSRQLPQKETPAETQAEIHTQP